MPTVDLLWTCTLTSQESKKEWRACDHIYDGYPVKLVLKSAVLDKRVYFHQNTMIVISSKDKEGAWFEQQLVTLTHDNNEIICNFDLTLAYGGDLFPNQQVTFKLVSGHGPVFITCVNSIETGQEEINSIQRFFKTYLPRFKF